VLRAAVRSIEADELPSPTTGKLARDLAVRHSHPTWVVRRWLERFGEEETVALLKSDNVRPSYSLRINTLRTSQEEFGKRLDDLDIAWRPSKYLNDFVVVERLQPIIRGGLLADGLCSVQDEAAGLVVRMLAPQPGETILDGAAAPGGKALYAAQLMKNEGRIVAIDLHEARTRLIRTAADAHGSTIIEPQTADLRTAEFDTQFDRVLLDVPCSGLGVLAKRADLRWQASLKKIEELVDLQDELLDAAAHHVRPGGLLVYSTCTIAPEENAERVRAFLERHSSFSTEQVQGVAPTSMQTPEGYFATLPHIHGMDGAFAARLRKALK
jgi:16S rRNA (cytosine967-C5)-methyltransferase